jgi:hypothetical protein
VTADLNGAEIGVSLRAAILRARVARGAKPEIAITGKSGGLTWSVGAQGGKPSVGVAWEGRT